MSLRMRSINPPLVTPAKAGVQGSRSGRSPLIPAFAGMTNKLQNF